MQVEKNRVAEGMQEWRGREKNITSIFSEATAQSRHFKKVKLDYLRDLHRDTRKDASKDEKMALRILKGEIKNMEKDLYPRRWERLLRKAFHSVKNAVRSADTKVADKTLWMRPATMEKEREVSQHKDVKQQYEKELKRSVQKKDLREEQKQSQRKGLRP